ncbi:hypothetical protein RJ640_022819 [Escallonia rubra]|uniref:Uncharacterized protein n=1 Tax=Escallonia rubra TaxID=112253 RepID=A0AA88QJC3_9ASTE|nr:hypothetical protein RJ640_022819 [Escallonia rubra]
MFALICKRSGSLVNPRISIITHLGFLQVPPIIPFSSQTTSLSLKSSKKDSFTVSYLINRCGLSPEIAASKSKTVVFNSPERPDSVLALLGKQGFDTSQISKLIRTYPTLLLVDPKKTLLPKLEFFRSIGASSDDIASNRGILRSSLDNKIIPFFNLLKSLGMSDKRLVSVMKRLRWNLHAVPSSFVSNVALLKQIGMPQASILSLIAGNPDILNQDMQKFDSCVNRLVKMGVDPCKLAFVQAIMTTCSASESTWEHKKEVYRRWGWSDHDLLSDFQRTIVPRCSVLRVLLSKGLLKEVPGVSRFIRTSEEEFLDKFVKKYLKLVPQLLSVYQGKVSWNGL